MRIFAEFFIGLFFPFYYIIVLMFTTADPHTWLYRTSLDSLWVMLPLNLIASTVCCYILLFRVKALMTMLVTSAIVFGGILIFLYPMWGTLSGTEDDVQGLIFWTAVATGFASGNVCWIALGFISLGRQAALRESVPEVFS